MRPSDRPDTPTLIAVSLLVGLLGSLIHEGLGHAGLALALGASQVSIGSAVMNYDEQSVGELGRRLIALAGPLASAAQGVVGLTALRRTPTIGTAWYFWWLLGHTGLFAAAGYLLALSFAPFGDIDAALRDLPLELLWRTGSTLLGAFLAYRAMVHAALTLSAHLPDDAGERCNWTRRLTLIPYLLVGLVAMLATLAGTRDLFLTLASAGAASFGSGILLVWVNFVLPRLRRLPPPGEPLSVPRTPSWLLIGGAALLAWVWLASV
ncbi:hypothetical protein FNU79_13700 [Deinococcus detaillensis]|uniref:Uncharacterized protein n=1 Tax=Deinococcus detaillensis TaxID=2592048 RepID=A0A553UQH3_9DEIO|nr:hypothetical protein [Deinococcus detaillensis]TSA82425.1 hypothetical protein FNU79_13700 [Deinococcus detaillensis]